MSQSLKNPIQKLICTLCIIISAVKNYRDLSNWFIFQTHLKLDILIV